MLHEHDAVVGNMDEHDAAVGELLWMKLLLLSLLSCCG